MPEIEDEFQKSKESHDYFFIYESCSVQTIWILIYYMQKLYGRYFEMMLGAS